MLARRIAAIAVAVAIPLAGVAGGIVGNEIARAERTAALDAYNSVATWNAEQDVRRSYADGQAADAADAAFQPALDAANDLADSSAGKASDEARAALSGAVATYATAYRSASFQDGTEAQSVQARAQDAAQTAIDAATVTVNSEVAAWQAAEDARIAAEQAAAQEAEVRASTSTSDDDSDSARQSSASSSSNDESDPAPSSGRAWAEGIVASIAPGVPVVWGYTPAGGKYGGKYSPGSGTISLSDNVADRSGYAYSILVHEATHAGPQRGSCYSVWKGHFGGDAERFAQAYTLAHFGTTVGAYAAPSDDDLAAAGSC